MIKFFLILYSTFYGFFFCSIACVFSVFLKADSAKKTPLKGPLFMVGATGIIHFVHPGGLSRMLDIACADATAEPVFPPQFQSCLPNHKKTPLKGPLFMVGATGIEPVTPTV